jgi:hypothetical protein
MIPVPPKYRYNLPALQSSFPAHRAVGRPDV